MSDEPSPGNNVSPTPSVGSTGSIGGLAGVVGGAVVTGGVDVDVDVGDVSSPIDVEGVVGVVASGSARRATPARRPLSARDRQRDAEQQDRRHPFGSGPTHRPHGTWDQGREGRGAPLDEFPYPVKTSQSNLKHSGVEVDLLGSTT